MTLSFSEPALLRELYAMTALRSHILRHNGRRAFFTADQRNGLYIALEQAFSDIASRLGRRVTSLSFATHISSEPMPPGPIQPAAVTPALSDNYVIELTDPPGPAPDNLGPLLVKLLGRAIVCRTLSLAALDGDDRFGAAQAEAADRALAQALALLPDTVSTITPSY